MSFIDVSQWAVILILAACTAFNGFCLAKVWEFVKEEIVKPLFGAKR